MIYQIKKKEANSEIREKQSISLKSISKAKKSTSIIFEKKKMKQVCFQLSDFDGEIFLISKTYLKEKKEQRSQIENYVHYFNCHYFEISYKLDFKELKNADHSI